MPEDQIPPARVSEPGFFYDMPVNDYFADPCPTPSLTQSLVKTLDKRTPLHAWHKHSRLNPNFVRNGDDAKFDVGNVAHRLMLGRGKDFAVLDFDDWRTKVAKESREAAKARGQVPILPKLFDQCTLMVHAARAQLADRGLGHFFRDGAAEVVMAWRENGVWCRQMLDWLIGGGVMVDYKTTAWSVAPEGLGRMMALYGWDVQAAMAERGLLNLSSNAGVERRFFFVVQEAWEPYCLSVVEPPEDAMVMGRKKIARALTIWDRCLTTDQWPGYPLEIVRPHYPPWAESQWLEREVHEAAAERLPPENLIMAG